MNIQLTTLKIDNCPEDFAEMVMNIYHAFKSGVKGGIQINLSGGTIWKNNKPPFEWKYLNIDPESVTIIKKR